MDFPLDRSDAPIDDVGVPENDSAMMVYLDDIAQNRLNELPRLRQMLNLRFVASEASLTALNELLKRFQAEMSAITGKPGVGGNAVSAQQGSGEGGDSAGGFFAFFSEIFGLATHMIRSATQKLSRPPLDSELVKPRVEEFLALFMQAIRDLEANIEPVKEMKGSLESMAERMDRDLAIMQAYLNANPRSRLIKRIEREMANGQSGLVGIRNELRNLTDQLGARIISSSVLQTQLPFVATNLVTAAMASQGAAEIDQAQKTAECVRSLNEALALLSVRETGRAVLGTVATAYSLPLSVAIMEQVRGIRDETRTSAAALVHQREMDRDHGLRVMRGLLANEPAPATEHLLGFVPDLDLKKDK